MCEVQVLRRWTPVCAIQDHEPEAGLRIPKRAFDTAKLAVGVSVDPAPHGVGKYMVAREVHTAIMPTPQQHDEAALWRSRQNTRQPPGLTQDLELGREHVTSQATNSPN